MKFETARIHFLSDVFVVVAVTVTSGFFARNGHMTRNTWIANDAVGQEIKNKEMTSFK